MECVQYISFQRDSYFFSRHYSRNDESNRGVIRTFQRREENYENTRKYGSISSTNAPKIIYYLILCENLSSIRILPLLSRLIIRVGLRVCMHSTLTELTILSNMQIFPLKNANICYLIRFFWKN